MVRFDKPCRLVGGAVTYFKEHMALGDYLTQEGSVQMVWHGQGAKRLGLAGGCRRDDFERLCEGRHPTTGQFLLVRDKGRNRRVCFFGQISPPKDVSLAYLVGGDTRIGGWWDEAVRETLQEIEAEVATRVRRNGSETDRTTGCMIAAVVTHDANRALDPQLHSHVCILNLTFDQVEQRWKGVQPSGFYRQQGYFREVCYNRLACRLRSAGYELETVKGIGFNLKGFPAELRERFSKRRREILRQAALVGATSQDELQAITCRSRAAKTQATAAELQMGWQREAGPALAIIRAVIAGTAGVSPRPAMNEKGALASAVAHVFERESVTDNRTLLREALVAGRGQISLDGVKTELAECVKSGELLEQGRLIVSPASLAAENEFVAWAEARRESHSALGISRRVSGLSSEQMQAVAAVLQSASAVTVLQGDAGTGKTSCLKAVVAGVTQMGRGVFGCAPSAAATDVLRQELATDAGTFQHLMASTKMQAEMRGRLLIVDEAGFLSVRDLRDLCRLATQNDYRILLVGDTKQHTAVEAGDALRCLLQYTRVPVARLKEIHRQRNPRYRQAVALLAKQDAKGALSQLARMGAIHAARDFPSMLRQAATDYVRTVSAGQSCLVVSPVWAEIHAFNDEARRQLKAAGILGAAERPLETIFSLKWTREERRRPENYERGDKVTFFRASAGFAKGEVATVDRREGNTLVLTRPSGREHNMVPSCSAGFDVGIGKVIRVAVGDRLLIRANHAESSLKNGDLVEVAAFGPDGSVALKDGRLIPAAFRHFAFGYATTSHSAQGKTVERGIFLLGDEAMAAGNLKSAYVGNSRFRESQGIYTTDYWAAREAMQRPADRLLAKEVIADEAGGRIARPGFNGEVKFGVLRP